MPNNFLSEYVDLLAQPIAWFYSLLLHGELSHRLAVVTVIFLIVGIFFFFAWSISRFQRRNQEWVEETVQKVAEQIEKDSKYRQNEPSVAPVETAETVRIPFFYTRKPLGLSKERSVILERQGIGLLNIATIRINKLRDVVHFGLVLTDRLSDIESLYYLIVITENRFIEPFMSRPEIVERVTSGKLQIHFICYEKLAIKYLREKYKIMNSVLPFPGTAFFLRQNKDGFFLKKASLCYSLAK